MAHGESMLIEAGSDQPFIANMQSVAIQPFDFMRQDPHADTIGLIPELFKRSRQGAVTLAESYRGFWVGAAAVAYDPSPDNPRRAIYTAGNFKAKLRDEEREPHDVEVSKVCAEMDILFRAEKEGRDKGFEWVGAIVIAATIHPDRIESVTGVPSATLHPCEECGKAFKHSDLIDQYTPIFTTASASEFKKYQLQSYRQYEKRYERFRKGEGFQDAKLRDYIASEWAYRRDLYLRDAKRAKINGSVHSGSPTKEKARRQLKLQIMSRVLGFEKDG